MLRPRQPQFLLLACILGLLWACAQSNGDVPAVADTKFSHNRGFYNAPFEVTITCATPGAGIYYTLDGSEPGTADGGVPAGSLVTGPITISSTTCLRARAIKDGWLSSNVDTQTYIFVQDVIQQSQQAALAAGYPSSWSGYGADYEMDPEVCDNAYYKNLMADALRSLPALSVVTDKRNLFDPAVGVYTNPLKEGPDLEWERPASAELFCADGTERFHVNCGLRIQGGHSRHPNKSPKHSLSLRFRALYGPTKLDCPLFGEDWPVDSFDTLHLRGGFNNVWIHWASDQRQRAQYIRDQWMRDSLTAMGNPDALQGFPVHLYLNGMYWGLYTVQERPDADHYAAYNGGDAEMIDAINGDPTYVISDPLNTGSVSDGTIDAWLELKDVVANRDWQRICELMDVDSFIDWMLLNYLAGVTDIKQGTNWRAAGGGPDRRPWRFYVWDAEHVLEDVQQTGIRTASDPSGLFNRLDDIAEFRIRFGDRVHKHLFNDGALTTQRNIDRWALRADEIDLAIIGESARWGDYRRDVHRYQSAPYYLYTRNGFWLPEKLRLLNDYFPRRNAIALLQFKSLRLYPSVDAPVLHIGGTYQHGGHVAVGALLSISRTAGTIWYTLDGTDPRAAGTGAVSTTATRYASPVRLERSVCVKARVLLGTTWSALNEAVFSVGPVAESLRISEIMYHPANTGNPDDPNTEYVELVNIGAESINLAFVTLANSVRFTFPSFELAPGAYCLVVKDAAAFSAKYGPGLPVAGQYDGSLSNGGEWIELRDAAGTIIHGFRYQDNWFDATDGKGYSLTVADPWTAEAADFGDESLWQASASAGGSPGQPD